MKYIQRRTAYKTVTAQYSNPYAQTVYIRISDANGKSQTLIANTIHPFFANGRWTAAGSLKTRLTIFRLPFCVNTNTLPL
ncbi:polymorphic toxin-type HINT domain-containing protein [Kingella oralis]|uniref:polymorphic toxin-type HINT domain-containing protein n=1 Tax=Kingella oralis TaxID=505 RepID=UPI002D8093D1|nr:polymorphic toxin-type HINT domain-containing protein [Kingella oralis]